MPDIQRYGSGILTKRREIDGDLVIAILPNVIRLFTRIFGVVAK